MTLDSLNAYYLAAIKAMETSTDWTSSDNVPPLPIFTVQRKRWKLTPKPEYPIKDTGVDLFKMTFPES